MEAQSQKPIKAILVSAIAPMSNHAANGGEKLLGNASSIKQRTDGRVYISGQMQRHALFSAIERLNMDEHIQEGKVTFVANGDGPTTQIDLDLRSDLGGYLDTQGKTLYSQRRTAPLTATPAVALKPSDVERDLLVRLKENPEKEADQKQALATNQFSAEDEMVMSFFLDLSAAGIDKKFNYGGDGNDPMLNESHIATIYDQVVSDPERLRRARLFLEATNSLTDYAMQARFATSAEPEQVLIVLDTKLSRKAARFFTAKNDAVRANILADLKARGARYFFGDDTSEGDAGEIGLRLEALRVLTEPKGKVMSVREAYEAATDVLKEGKIYTPPKEIAPKFHTSDDAD